MLRKIVAITVALAFGWEPMALTMPGVQQPAPGQLTYEQAVARLDRFMKLIEELRSHIDRSQFDLDALLDKLDYDPDQIIRFVSGEIAFEQYPGLLRGAKGTLMSRAGNALDQSVLLATLLKDAGADARILRGTLSPSDARRLLDRMFLPRSPRPPIGDEQAMEAALAKLGGGAADATTATSGATDPFAELRAQMSPLYATAQETTEDFQRRLSAAGIALGDPEMPRKLTTEAQDYFWVQYRLGAAGGWETVHPAFGKDHAPAVQRSQTIADSVPEELQQRVRFEVEIEQQLGGRLIRKKVMSGWERPAANLIGLQMRYLNVPSGMSKLSDPGSPDEMAAKSDFFLPTFNGGLAPHAQLFDLDGVTAPPEAGGSSALGVVKQVGKKAEAATSALSGLGGKAGADSASPDVRSLTGAWLVYTLTQPGGSATTTRRTLYDAIGDERRSGGRLVGNVTEPNRVNATWDLAREVTFLVAPGDYPPAYALDLTLQRLLALRAISRAVLDVRFGKSDRSATDKALRSLDEVPDFGLLAPIAGGTPAEEGLSSYIARPAIVSAWAGITPASGGAALRSAIDIVAQGRRTFRRETGGPRYAVRAAMTAGVWATYAERTVSLPGRVSGADHIGAPRMLEDARRNGVGLRVIAPLDEGGADSLEVPTVMKRSVKAALAEGYAVIAPERVTAGMAPGWWRVDPATGQTLGMGPQGRGVDVVQSIILAGLIALSLPAGIGGFYLLICRLGSSCSRLECAENAWDLTVESLLAGAVIWLATVIAVGLVNAAWGEGAGTEMFTEGVEALHHAHQVGEAGKTGREALHCSPGGSEG
jgi:hypothetical protein